MQNLILLCDKIIRYSNQSIMKKSILLFFCFFCFSNLNAQSWGSETSFLYQNFWYDNFPSNIAGFRAATIEKWQTGAWVNSGRYTIPQLDAKNAPLSIEYSLWDKPTNQFVRFNRTNCINNANGQALSLRSQTFVAASGTWKDGYRDTLGHSAGGLTLHKTSLSLFPNNVFKLWERDTFYYFPNNNLKFRIHQLRGTLVATGEEVWGDDQQDSFVYDATNRLIEWHQKPWTGIRFADLQRQFFDYDASNRRKTFARVGSSATISGGWDTLFRYEYTYNAQGQVSEMLRKQRLAAGIYANHTRFTFTYTAAGLVQQELMESNISGNWTNNTRITYSYTPLSTENWVLSDDVLSIHPNPSTAGSGINIRLLDSRYHIKSVKVFDVRGNLMATQMTVFGGQKGDFAEINVTQKLGAGLYFCKIEMTDGQFLTKKWTVF